MFHLIRKAFDTVVPPISGVLFLAGVGSTVVGAIVRTTGLPFSVVWVEEVTRYALIWATLLLMGIGFRKKAQTQFTLLEEHLRGRAKAGLNLLILLLELLIFGMLAVGGFQLAWTNQSQRSAVLMLSMMWPYLAIPVSSTLVLAELAMMLCESLSALMGKARGGGAKEAC